MATRNPKLNLQNRPRFYGCEVLLIEDEESSREHSNILSQNFYGVTSTTTTTSGLSLMQQEGNIYDCVLVDGDIDTPNNMTGFIHQVFKLQPNTTLMMIVSKERVRVDSTLPKLYLEYSPLLLLKPCKAHKLSDIRDHVALHMMLRAQRGELTANKRPGENVEEKPNISKKKCT